MKAITCSQCGALIEDVAVDKKFTKCDYCNAKFRLQEEKVFDISRKEAKRFNADFQKPFPIKYTPQREIKLTKILLPVMLIMLLTTIIPIVIFFAVSGGFPELPTLMPKLKVDISVTAKTVVTGNSFDLLNFETLNFDNVEFPKYSESEMPDVDAEELIETVFSERKINVEVKVDKKGNITQVKALNGHKYLRQICEAAALKTTFFTPVNSDVTVIYLFSVKKR